MAKLIAVCLALAGLSLLLPSEPSYDPWAWLVWGRELAHLGLDTTGGPSWKPLPVAFTTVVARLEGLDEGLPAALWMVVARAGALLAVALAFRLAFGLAGGGLAGGLGGAVAAVAVCLMPDWLQFVAHGSEAPMAVAFMLWAVERHLDRRSEPAWSLSQADQPWLRALERAHNHAGLAVELLALAAIAAALVRRRWAVAALATGALAGVAVYAAMTEAGFSGSPRYVLPALAVASVLAGVGAATLMESGAGFAGLLIRRPARSPRLPRLAGAVAGLALIALVGAPFVDERVRQLRSEARQVGLRMEVHGDLARAVDRLGGPHAVAALGSATANRALHSRLAWELRVPIDRVESVTDHRVVFRSPREGLNGGVYVRGRAKMRETLGRVGSIRVYRRDRITFPLAAREWEAIGALFTGRLQGVYIGAGDGRNSRIRVVTR